MRRIPPDRSLLVYFDELVYLESALLAHPDTADLAAPVTELLARFAAILQLDLDSRRAGAQAAARVAVADLGLDDAVRWLHSAVLGLVRQNRKSREFTELFSGTIAEVVRYGLQRQVEVVEALVARLGLPIYPDALRGEHTAALSVRVAAGKAALDGRRKAELGRTEARLGIDDWKADVNEVRLAVYGTLLGLAARNGGGRKWADAFFPMAERDSDAPVVAPVPAPAPAEPAAVVAEPVPVG